jgi:hypothetical protein
MFEIASLNIIRIPHKIYYYYYYYYIDSAVAREYIIIIRRPCVYAYSDVCYMTTRPSARVCDVLKKKKNTLHSHAGDAIVA